eukprot:763334-Hanusia_phi.AAC.4
MDNLEHASATVRASAEETIIALVDEDACPVYVFDRILQLCYHQDQDLSVTGMKCLGKIRKDDGETLDIILEGVVSNNKLLHAAAIDAVRRRSRSAALFDKVMCELRRSETAMRTESFLRAAEQLELEEKVEELTALLAPLAHSSNDLDREKVLQLCSLLIDKTGFPPPLSQLLLLLSKDKHQAVKEAAAQLLHRATQRRPSEEAGGAEQVERDAPLQDDHFDNTLLLRNRRDPDNDPEERRCKELLMGSSCHGVRCGHRRRRAQEVLGILREDVRDPFSSMTWRIVKQLQTDIPQERRRKLVESLRSLSLLCGFRGFRASVLAVDLLLWCDHADARVSGAHAAAALVQRQISMRCALTPIRHKLLLLLLDGDQLVRTAVLAVLPDVFPRGSEEAMSVLFGDGKAEEENDHCLLHQLELSRSRGRGADVETLTEALGAIAPLNDSSALTVLGQLVKEEAPPVRLSALLSVRRLFVGGRSSHLDQLVLSVALACGKEEEDKRLRLVAEDLLLQLGGVERAYRMASRTVPSEEERDVRFSVDRAPLAVLGMDLREYREEEEERVCEDAGG